ncbi:MAG: SIS domain-containing protein [Flavobacteriales bacterium]
MNQNEIKDILLDSKRVLENFLNKEETTEVIQRAGEVIVTALNKGNKIIACGNGGSLCDAMHFTEELTGNFKDEREPIPAFALSDSAHITCTANDFGFDKVFSRSVDALGEPGDILLAISTSGSSRNIVNAVNTAKKKNMKIVSLTGKNGGDLSSISDVEIRAPFSDYSDRTQEIHIKVLHILVEYIEANFN